MEKKLHIVAFDIPYPPTYGGAIDVFYRIKALYEKGIRIMLHCYYKTEREETEPLEQLCERVYYYQRSTSLSNHIQCLPYSVASRQSRELLSNLLQDKAPILFEGLVSCALIGHPALSKRRKYFRECNIEHEYYHALGQATNNIFSKCSFYIEALRLKHFEHVLNHATHIFAISPKDETYFKAQYPNVSTTYIPCFHGHYQVNISSEASEPYILYHGNLAVAENSKAAMYIIRHIAPHTPYPIVIAGNRPPEWLKRAGARHSNITIVASPEKERMEELISKAQVHLLITFQDTGIKLKLLNVLYSGKHIVVNKEMVSGTGVEPLCHLAHNKEELVLLTNTLMCQPLTQEEITKREELLQHSYNNAISVQRMIDIIYAC